ncbi:MAG: AAA family ATPase [Acidimicrobiia bacterium]|nr:AAA family ATPase [Acidimicrobiia bacterium]
MLRIRQPGRWLVEFVSPRRAVAFGIALQRSLSVPEPFVRVAISTEEETDRPPTATSVAEAMSERTSPGAVMLTDVVRQLAGPVTGVRFVSERRQRLRGRSERLLLWSAVESDLAPEAQPVFGREAELEQIDRVIDDLVEGTGRALVLEGEAGIGKTHLVNAVGARARARGVTVVVAGFEELERTRPGTVLFGLGRALGIESGSSGYQADTTPFRLIDSVVDAIAEAATSTPMLVAVEDLHWGDDLSLRGLDAISRRTSSLAAALVVTMRPSPRPDVLAPLLDSLQRRGSTIHRLEGLDHSALMALASLRCGGPPGRDLARRLSATAGNPLFAVELINALEDSGSLRLVGGTVEATADELPASLRDTILRRLSMLSPDGMELLRLASLLGSQFTLADLATVAGRSIVDVAAQLREAVDAAFVTGDGITLAFRHELLREAVHEDIAPAIRHDLHAAAARSLAHAGAPTRQAARHFALGARKGDTEAADWLARAASEITGLDPQTSVSLGERALEVAPADWASRVETEITLLDPLARVGRLDDARRLADRLLEEVDDDPTRFLLLRALSGMLTAAGDLRNSAEHLDRAAAVPGVPRSDLESTRWQAAGQHLLAGDPVRTPGTTVEGDGPEADAVGAAGGYDEAAIDRLDADGRCTAYQTRALFAAAEGHYEEAREHARRAAADNGSRAASRAVTVGPDLWPDIWVGTSHFWVDDFDAALAVYETVAKEAERRGELTFLVQTAAGSAGIHYLAGRWTDACREIETGLDVAHETGAHAHLALSHAIAARVALGRGEPEEARRQLEAADRARGLHSFGLDLLAWAWASVLELEGDARAALHLLTEAWRVTASLRGLLQYQAVAPPLVRLARDDGDEALARAVVADVEILADRGQVMSGAAAARRCRGLLESDVEVLAEAVAAYRSTPRRVEFAATCEELATYLLAAGQIDEAVTTLDEAAAVYADCGARAYLARIDATLRAHGRRRRRSPPRRNARAGRRSAPESSRSSI